LRVPHIFELETFGGTVSPQPVHRKTIYRACCAQAMAAAGLRPEQHAPRALTFRPSNHSFIQAFEMQLPVSRAKAM
jgi:hypothetical protein